MSDADLSAPVSYWMSAPANYDFGRFLERAFDGAIPKDIEWEEWSRPKFDAFVGLAKDFSLEDCFRAAVWEDLDGLMNAVVGKLELSSGFIRTMVENEAKKAVRADPQVRSAASVRSAAGRETSRRRRKSTRK